MEAGEPAAVLAGVSMDAGVSKRSAGNRRPSLKADATDGFPELREVIVDHLNTLQRLSGELPLSLNCQRSEPF